MLFAGNQLSDDWNTKTNSALAVALFAVHPLRVEVVAWVSCQPYLLCTFFLLVAVMAYLRSCTRGATHRRTSLALSVAAFTAALLSKAPAIVLPLILIVIDVYPLRRLGGSLPSWFSAEARQVWWEKLPFLVLSFIFGFIAVQARDGACEPGRRPAADSSIASPSRATRSVFFSGKQSAQLGCRQSI